MPAGPARPSAAVPASLRRSCSRRATTGMLSATDLPARPPGAAGGGTMPTPLFTGVGVALVTLFDDQQQVDHDATGKLAAQLVELGADALIVAGTTGEADALDDEERLRLFETVRTAVPAGVVVGGTGAPSARQA